MSININAVCNHISDPSARSVVYKIAKEAADFQATVKSDLDAIKTAITESATTVDITTVVTLEK